jgi:TetR/AcrR family transcriptional repressor of nem operon
MTHRPARRGRPARFDRETALDAAIGLFWRHGYTATTTEMLVRAMGMRRGSIYAAFGGKEQLFLEALDVYAERMERAQEELFRRAASPRRAMEDFFRGAVRHLATDEGAVGCLLAVTGVERALGNRTAHRRVERHRARLERSFAAAIRDGQQRGEIGRQHSARELARYFAHGRIALGALARMRPGRAVLRDVVEVMLTALDGQTLQPPADGRTGASRRHHGDRTARVGK